MCIIIHYSPPPLSSLRTLEYSEQFSSENRSGGGENRSGGGEKKIFRASRENVLYFLKKNFVPKKSRPPLAEILCPRLFKAYCNT